MTIAARYPLHRVEVAAALERGDAKIAAMTGEVVRHVRARQTLAETGETLDWVFRVREGWFARARTLADGRRQIILTFLPGDLLGIKAMLLRRQPDAIEALSKGSVEIVDRRRLALAFHTDPDVAMRIHWQAIDDERRLHTWVVGLGQADAEERMALMLLGFRGRLIAAGLIASGARSFVMPLTQEQMADHLGLSQVHVNRVLRRLREGGLVAIERGVARLGDVPALAAIADAVRDEFERAQSEYGGDGDA